VNGLFQANKETGEQIERLGQYAAASFTSASDGNGGTIIGEAPPAASVEASSAPLAAPPQS
jgi:hypothetical protein